MEFDPSIRILTTDFSFVRNSLYNGADINISGATRLFLCEADAVLNTVTNPATSVVTEIVTVKSWSVFNNVKDLNFETKFKNSRNGGVYDTNIQFTIPGISTIKNKIITALQESNYVVIVQDNNDSFWLLGADKSFDVDEGVIGTATNGYTVKLSTRELKPLQEVAPAFMLRLSVNPYADTTQALQAINLPYTSVDTPASGTAGVPPVIFPVNNYTVASGVTFVLITSGNTVKLPPSPVTGREITFKDGGTGGTTPCIINGNGKLIEGDATAELNTDGGTMTLLYANGGWKVKSFWNI